MAALVKRASLLLLAYLLTLALFWHICDHLTPEQAIAVSLLQAVLMLTTICVFFKPHPSEVDHETE